MEKLKHTYLAAIVFIIAMLYPTSSHAEAIGTWTIYPSYYNIENIEMAGHDIFVLASSNLYSYNTDDESLTTYTKTTCLSDVNISKISWNKNAKRLVVVYNSHNIDILSADGNVINIPDLKDKQMTGDKTINNITQDGQYAYLATNFGVVKIDVKNGYIADSYILNKPVKQLALLNGYIYGLTTQNGVIRANMSDNLNDPASWKTFSSVFFEYLFTLNGHLIGMTNGNANSINTETASVTTFGLFPFTWVKKCNDRIICGTGSNMTEISSDLVCHTYSASHPLNVVAYDEPKAAYWSNNSDNKLTRFVMQNNELMPQTTGIIPDGPVSNATYRMALNDKDIYVVNGFCNVDATSLLDGRVYQYNGSYWSEFEKDIAAKTGHRYRDLCSIAINPLNPDIVMASGETGVYKFDKGIFVEAYDCSNSPLVSMLPTNSEPRNWTVVQSMTYDKEGNLWLANSRNEGIVCLKANGTWERFDHPDIMAGDYTERLEGATIDSRGYLWFCSTHWEDSRLFCYDIKNDRLKRYDMFANQDGTTYTPYLHNISEDNAGNIWIATNHGPFYLKASDILQGNDVMTQHKVPRNDGTNFADYLLTGIDILCITTDAANRKWIGTNGQGVFVISDDCNTQEYHFTADNSSLPSDIVTDIKVQGSTGRIYFATEGGLCSYMSGVSESNDNITSDNVWAYPNPVTPEYDGYVTVCGLENNSQVTITTSSGAKVASGRSVGGSYIWDCRDLNGQRVASGMYIVHVATPEGNSSISTKIAVVR